MSFEKLNAYFHVIKKEKMFKPKMHFQQPLNKTPKLELQILNAMVNKCIQLCISIKHIWQYD